MRPSSALALFAVCAPGLEEITARELRCLGLAPAPAEGGGIPFAGPPNAMYRANLWLRTATRVLVRVGEFGARGFAELERHASRLPWERFLAAEHAVRLRVTCRKSKLYHSGAVAERVAGSIERRASASAAVLPDEDDDEEAGAAQLVVVRMLHDRCTISIDSSGALLHRRGYRMATAKAPIRETLAAAVLTASGWDGSAPLLDPLCGAGTIPIEAALLARRLPPGGARRFAFMAWPGFDKRGWDATLDAAEQQALPRAPAPIAGSDRDAGAVEASRANAVRAGVAEDIVFSRRALSALEPLPAPAWIVTNPPYGVRVGDRHRLRNLYAQLGNVARRACAGCTLTVLSADVRLEHQLGVPLEVVLRTRNGGIPVRVVRATV